MLMLPPVAATLMLPPVAATDLTPQEVHAFCQAQGLTEKQADHQALQLGECVTEETFMIAKAWEWITDDLIQYLPMDALIRLSDFYARKKGQAIDRAHSMLDSASAVPSSNMPLFKAYYAEYRKAARKADEWVNMLDMIWKARGAR